MLLEPLLLFSVLFLPGFIAQGFQDTAPDMFESAYFNLYYIVTALPQIALILYVIVLKPGRSLSDFDIGPFRPSDLLRSLAVLCGIYLCIMPIGLITMLIEPEMDNQLVYGTGWQFSRIGLLPLVLISCLTTGYIEELFFRSYLYTSLRNAGTKIIPAVAVTSLLFGSGHIYEGWYAFAATAAIGIFLSCVFIKTKSIHTVAVGHGLYNFSVLLIAMMGVS